MSNTPLRNDRLLRALRRQPVDCTPVWLMRQAGRYLPEYRATRAKAGSFLAMAKNPDIACEVTLQPLARFDLDAAILFSDILTIPDAMGLELYFVDGEGPKFKHTVRSAADLAKLRTPDMETDLRYVMDAVRLIRRELDGKAVSYTHLDVYKRQVHDGSRAPHPSRSAGRFPCRACAAWPGRMRFVRCA